jgi:hypothetical protein
LGGTFTRATRAIKRQICNLMMSQAAFKEPVGLRQSPWKLADDGGRGVDRTRDPLDVNEVLSR